MEVRVPISDDIIRKQVCPKCPYLQFYEQTGKMRNFIEQTLKKIPKVPIKKLSISARKVLNLCKKLAEEKKTINWGTVVQAEGKDPSKTTDTEKRQLARALQTLRQKGFLKKIGIQRRLGVMYTCYKMVEK